MIPRLNGTRVLITREKRQAQKLADLVSDYGGEPVVAPLLAISCKCEETQRTLFHSLSDYHWVFFTSVNGVHCFFHVLQEQGISASTLSSCKLAVVGSKTASALQGYGYTSDFIPSVYNADVMAEEFLERFPNAGSVLLVRGNLSRSTLPEEFSKYNVPYEIMDVYETLYNEAMKDRINELIRKQSFDMLTFTSPSTVQAFVEMKSDVLPDVGNLPTACIGTTTEQKARSAGFVHTITPNVFTIENMVEMMNDYMTQKG